jgi:3-oxoadipyl-CoA thiolase
MPRAFIADYVRTPIGRYGGALSGVRTDDLAATPIAALMSRNQAIDWSECDEVMLGCANQAGEDNRNVARMAALLAGLPETVPGLTMNRLCGSGLDAVIAAARAIRSGEAELIIAGGVESMSRAPFVMPKAESGFDRRAEIHDTTIGWRFVNDRIARQYGIESMPETAENVATDYGVSRADQDAFALRSQERAAVAQASGRLAQEICSVQISRRNNLSNEVTTDEHPRQTTLEKLAALPTPFRSGGSVTAGNASGINDGAAALIICSETALTRHGLSPLAEITGAASAGVAPRVMGMGPVPAVNKLCWLLGCRPVDFDRIELNEAFAAQAIAVLRGLGMSEIDDRVNPHGGAIALGHPLGMSGARLVGTAAVDMAAQRATTALCTMCVGVGQGVALGLRAV